MNDKEFVQELGALGFDTGEVRSIIRAALTNLLGEIAAAAVMAHTGDAADGNLSSFARRMQELLEGGTPVALDSIVAFATQSADRSQLTTSPVLMKTNRDRVSLA